MPRADSVVRSHAHRIALSVWREMKRSRVPEGELATQSSHARAPPSSIDVLGGDVCRDGRLPLVAILQQLLLIVKQLLQPRCPRCARRGSPERPRLQMGSLLVRLGRVLKVRALNDGVDGARLGFSGQGERLHALELKVVISRISLEMGGEPLGRSRSRCTWSCRCRTASCGARHPAAPPPRS